MEHSEDVDYRPMITETQRITSNVKSGAKVMKRKRVKDKVRKRKMRVLDVVLVVSVVACVCLMVSTIAFISYLHGFGSGTEHTEQVQATNEVTSSFANEVKDVAAPYSPVMPVYLQDDSKWADIPYGNGTLSSSGCGLVCASMAIEYLTGVRMNPDDLQSIVKDTCLTDGVNDPSKFIAYATGAYDGLSGTDIYYAPSKAVEEVRNGAVVFASMKGAIGAQEYDGHVVLLWDVVDDGNGGYNVYYRDPKNGVNSVTPLSQEQFRDVNWVYFYSLRGEGIGS